MPIARFVGDGLRAGASIGQRLFVGRDRLVGLNLEFSGVGVGIIFGNYLAAALRNPSAAQGQFGNLIFGFAITEALGIFSLLIALLLLFAL